MRQNIKATATWLSPGFLLLGLLAALLIAATLAPGGASAQQDDNDSPSFDKNEFDFTIPENSAAGASVGAVQASDPEGDSLSYSMGRETDARSFALDSSGRLTVAQGAVLNYEAKRTFYFTVRVTDGKGSFGNSDSRYDDTTRVIVRLSNVDEPGELTLRFPRLSPDRPLEDAWVTASVIDPDSGHNFAEAEWEWEYSEDRDADDDDWASVASAFPGGQQSFYRPPRALIGNYLRVTVSYDTSFPDLQKTTQYPVKAFRNSAPEFALGVRLLYRHIPENSPANTVISDPVTATDRDKDMLTYSLAADSSPYFTINESTGHLTFTGGVNIDHEEKPRKVFYVTVAVTDGKHQSGLDDDDIDATIRVRIESSDVEERGSVSFEATSDPAPRQGALTRARLHDPDVRANPRNEQWEWETSADKDADDDEWSQVGSDTDSTISEYRPTAADVGKYLRATISYNQVSDAKQIEQVISEYPVLPPIATRPAGLKATVDSGKVTLSWDNPNDPDILKYQYIQSTGHPYDGEWTDIPNSDANTTQFTITGLTDGVHYSWTVGIVHKVHGTRIRGGFPAHANAVVKPNATPAPTGLTVQTGNGGAVLSWNNPRDPSITGYQYARYDPSANSPQVSAWEAIPNSDKDTTQFTISGLTNGVRYIYYIRAMYAASPGYVTAVPVIPSGGDQSSQQLRSAPGKPLVCMEEMIGRRLYKDCSTLLSVKDELDGEGILNWNVLVPIPYWDGLTVKGKPKRVKRIELEDKGLTGSIPADLRKLNGMTHLNLNGNNLTDACTPAAIADRLKVSKPKPCAGE